MERPERKKKTHCLEWRQPPLHQPHYHQCRCRCHHRHCHRRYLLLTNACFESQNLRKWPSKSPRTNPPQEQVPEPEPEQQLEEHRMTTPTEEQTEELALHCKFQLTTMLLMMTTMRRQKA